VAHAYFFFRQLLLLALLLGPLTASAGIIVNTDVEERSISVASLRNIYTLRQTLWPNRQPIVVFVLPDDSPAHVAFAKEKLGLYPYRLRQTWDRMSFSGMASAPIQVNDENDMRARVRATPGAIGYTSKDMVYDGIKTLRLE
jgi:ABC-type phosphate transport system substrate-binding protein